MPEIKLNNQFNKDLKSLLQKLYLAEKSYVNSFDSLLLTEIITEYQRLEKQLPAVEDPQSRVILKKVLSSYYHFDQKMPLRHFLNFVVPLERYLKHELTDADFVITNQDSLDSVSKEKLIARPEIHFVLDHLRSAFNVGAFFRLADAYQISKIHLCGYTATPEQDVVKKTSLGSEKQVAWKSWDKTSDCLDFLKRQGYQLAALETSSRSQDLTGVKFSLTTPTVFIFGNERFGLDAELLKTVDYTISLPMFGTKNSLNVSQCASIVCFEWHRQFLNGIVK